MKEKTNSQGDSSLSGNADVPLTNLEKLKEKIGDKIEREIRANNKT